MRIAIFSYLILVASSSAGLVTPALAGQAYPVFEADTLADHSFNRCLKSAEGRTANTRACQREEYSRLMLRMEKRLSTIRALLPPAKKTTLEEVQDKWQKNYEKSCSVQYMESKYGIPGTDEEISYRFCIIDEIRYRIGIMEEYIISNTKLDHP